VRAGDGAGECRRAGGPKQAAMSQCKNRSPAEISNIKSSCEIGIIEEAV